MQGWPARRIPMLLVLLAATFGGSGAGAAGPDRTLSTATTQALPSCAYKDTKTRFLGLQQWRKTLVDTRLRVGSKYKPDDLVPTSNANIPGGGKVRRPGHR